MCHWHKSNPPARVTHIHHNKQFLNILSATMSDKLGNIVIIPCSVMTTDFYYFILRIVSNSERFLSVNNNVCLFLSWEFPLQIGLLIAQAKTKHLLKLQLACNLYNLLFICASRASLYIEISCACNYIDNMLENILLKSQSNSMTHGCKCLAVKKLSSHQCLFPVADLTACHTV